jgi:hypothetical protein
MLGLALAGCAHKAPAPLYEWGGYQSQLYAHLRGDLDSPLAQLGALLEQLQKTAAKGATVPPGLHAHIALLQLQAGQRDQALAHLRAEKALFPESAHYMDWLIARLQGPGA